MVFVEATNPSQLAVLLVIVSRCLLDGVCWFVRYDFNGNQFFDVIIKDCWHRNAVYFAGFKSHERQVLKTYASGKVGGFLFELSFPSDNDIKVGFNFVSGLVGCDLERELHCVFLCLWCDVAYPSAASEGSLNCGKFADC